MTQYADGRVAFFDDVVKGALARRDEIDAALRRSSPRAGRSSGSTRPCSRSCAPGAYELLARVDVATGTVISEYVDVAHAFFDARETKFVNGVLDAVAKAVRT
jgi:N utilization substance protein B